MDAQLRREAASPAGEMSVSAPRRVASPLRPIAWAIAATVLFALGAVGGLLSGSIQPEVIATLASVEEAAWQSALPTMPGSELTKGTLALTSGIATIRFRSGAEVTLQSPAKLAIETPMRAKLISGAAMVEVPDSAIGFVLATPEGYAVDHGTQFSVRVDEANQNSRFEVIDGEISIHVDATGDEARLTGQSQAATISSDTLATFDAAAVPPDAPAATEIVRIGTNGQATSVIGNNRRDRLRARRFDCEASRA